MYWISPSDRHPPRPLSVPVCLSFSRFPAASFLRFVAYRRISFYEGLERALLCALCRCLTILYRHCGQLHRICPFSALPLLSQRHLTYRPIDLSTFRLPIPYIPNFNQLYSLYIFFLTNEAVDKFEMIALTSWRWRHVVSTILRSR